MTAGHTAIVTGANHSTGGATARALARRGSAVLCTLLRLEDPDDPGTPQAYQDNRAQDAAAVVARIREEGGTAVAAEAGLSGPHPERATSASSEPKGRSGPQSVNSLQFATQILQFGRTLGIPGG